MTTLNGIFRIAAVLGLIITASGNDVNAEAIRFSTEPSAWKQVRSTVTMARGSSEKGTVKDGLRFRGTLSDSDASAISGEQPMSGFQKYRFSATICIDKLESSPRGIPYSNIPCPHFVCEFLTDDPDGVLGTYNLHNIAWKWGERYDISGEFRAPWGTTKCRIVIADGYDRFRKTIKKTDTITFAVDYIVANMVIEPIDRFSTDKWQKRAQRLRLKVDKGTHPRLFLTAGQFDELKRKTQTSHAPIWKEVRSQADSFLKSGPPEWRTNDTGAYDEQWWMANNGPSMITLAMAFRLTGERSYLDGAKTWALTTCAYPGWGVGWADGIDCMTGHNLFGLALVYDWLYHDLDAETLTTIRETILKRGSYFFGKASTGTIVPSVEDFRTTPWPEWEEVWLQNHLWINATGLLTAGLALADENDDVREWVVFAQDRFGKTMEMLGPDGASHEGINYWSYGIEHILKSIQLIRDLIGVDLYDYNRGWLKNTARYRIYMSIPRSAWKKQFLSINYGDSHPRDATGPDHILRALAAEYDDEYAQYYARILDESGTLLSPNGWLNLIWYDPSVVEKSTDSLPTLAHFEDQGIVSARSDWSGDESFLFYKCGPYIGERALELMNYCASSAHHTHPDQNEFALFAGKDWLFRDDGNYGKYTGQHNTLIIDGGEQLGGGESIFDGSRLHALKRTPKILRAESTPDFDNIAGDAAEAYPPETGLRKFTRHLLYLKKEKVLIVCDDIALDTQRNLELRFHPGPQEAENRNGVLFAEGDGARLRFEALTPEGVTLSSEKHPLVDRRYNRSEMLAFRLTKHGDRWRNIAAVSWAETGGEPVRATVRTAGDVVTIFAGETSLTFNWITGAAESNH